MVSDILNSNIAIGATPPPSFNASGSGAAGGDFAAKLGQSVDRLLRRPRGSNAGPASVPPSFPGSQSLNAPQAPNVPAPAPLRAPTPQPKPSAEPPADPAPSRSHGPPAAPAGHPRSRAAPASHPRLDSGAASEHPAPPSPDGPIPGDASPEAMPARRRGSGGPAASAHATDPDPAAAMLALLAAHRSGQAMPPASTPAALDTSLAGAAGAADAPPAGDMGPQPSASAPPTRARSDKSDFLLALGSATDTPDPLPTTVPDASPSAGAALLFASSAPPGLLREPAPLAGSTVLSMSNPQEFAASACSFATRALRDGTTQAVLRVSPEALGPVEARIQLARQPDGSSSLTMTLTLSNADALDTARQSLADLQQSLASAGLPPATLILQLRAPESPPASAQSSPGDGQRFDGSGGSDRQPDGRRAPGGSRGSSPEPSSPAWTPTRLFDKLA